MGSSCAPNRDGYDGDDDEVGFGDRLRLHVDEFRGDIAGLHGNEGGAGVKVDSSSSDDGIYICRIVNCQGITDPMCRSFVTMAITIMMRQSHLESVHSILVLHIHRLVRCKKMDCQRY